MIILIRYFGTMSIDTEVVLWSFNMRSENYWHFSDRKSWKELEGMDWNHLKQRH